jgi:large subunit ribosomal protein L13
VKTTWINESDIERKWYVVDAEDIILGRLATAVAGLLIGKKKVDRVPNMDCGDYVIVVNASKIRVTGKKLMAKKYARHSGYPGGFRERTLGDMMQNDSSEVVEKAVQNMLPKTKLRSGMMARLFAYSSATHPHEAQRPTSLKLS